ncbi:protein kinase domain-containing protein [Kitasatospora azatica]|uniref:protein kinase domain-containing protein n=1 Tax=Kitasatospora azatica TaxID=58347 RepID=UPI00055F3199|nr:protein kinase [Kitasatospora azatica]
MSNGMLETGATLATESGGTVTVLGLLGAGGQGEVYQVRTQRGDRALKWYYPESASPRQRQIVEDLVARGFADTRFLWPEEVVVGQDGLFGYLMGLRPDRYQGLPKLFRRQLKTTTRALLTAGVHMVEGYKALHSQGVAYRDISWGNVFFDPADGSVLICDNDNAVPEGADSGITGTMNFMAPELVRGDQGAMPRTQTDLHSLAVLLFMLLMNHHPLEGRLELGIKCKDEAAERRLYGTQPIFVFDPQDASNRPDPIEQATVLATWAATPLVLRRLFEQNFVEGLRDPGRRVRESQWRDALSQVLDTMVDCAACGRANMTEPAGAVPGTCWSCGRTLVLPPKLLVTTSSPRVTRIVRLGRGAQLFRHHLVGEPTRHDFTAAAVIAELGENPQRPGRFGLTNRSGTEWTSRKSDGSLLAVAPGRTVPLRDGLLVDLGGGAEALVQVG